MYLNYTSNIPQLILSWSVHLNYTSKYTNPPISGTSTHATRGVEAQFTRQQRLSPRCAFASSSRFSRHLPFLDADVGFAKDL